MGNDFKRAGYLYLSVGVVVLTLIVSSNMPGGANAMISITSINHHPAVCNGTLIGDCLAADDDEEFLMESQVSRRILASPPKPIVYQLGNADKEFCKTKAPYNCHGLPVRPEKRGCEFPDYCRHDDK